MNGSEKGGSGNGSSRRRHQRRRDKNRQNNNSFHSSNSSQTPAAGEHKAGGQKSDRRSEHRKENRGENRSPNKGDNRNENRSGGKRDERSFKKSSLSVADITGRYNRHSFSQKGGGKAALFARPKWVPPQVISEPLPVPDCPWCGKPIQDISFAIADRESGAPVHFECVAAKIAEAEILGKGDEVTYIGGGRFAVVFFPGSGGEPPQPQRQEPRHEPKRDFKIKKIIEWEDKDKRAEWRSLICDRYSVV